MRARVLLCTLLAALGAAALPATAGARFNAKKMIYGLPTINHVPQFPLYHALGVGIFETQIRWDEVAPTRPAHPRDPNDPAYHWPWNMPDAVAQGRHWGIRIAAQILGTPPWANGGRDWRWAPNRPQDFADFAAAAAKRYPSVHLWMVWGEPDRVGTFQPETPGLLSATRLTRAQAQAPRIYARMLDATYGTLKAISPANLIIGGNTWTLGDISASTWIRYLRLPNGRPPRLDLYGHNPFTDRRPDLRQRQLIPGTFDFSDLDKLAPIVDRNLGRRGHRHIRLFISEFTLPTAPTPEFNFHVSLATQASWLRAALRIATHWKRIYAFGWVHTYDDPPGTGYITGGLLNADGRPKPAYYAFRNG